jgi:hypothetical protein
MAQKPPDSVPRGYLKHKLETDVNLSKIRDPAVRREMMRRALADWQIEGRIHPEDIRCRRWPEPPPGS